MRDPIDLEIFSINQIGEVQILFSELLESLETVGKGKLTTRSISNSLVFDIRYLCMIDQSQATPSELQKMPKLRNWWVQNFTESEVILKLNFTNPLYVSTGEERDILRITFEQPSLFKSQLDGLTLEPEYTIEGKIPGQMVSEEEFKSK